MKRNWVWGLCATMIAGGAFAFAQQEGGSTAPVATPSSGATAPVQEVAPVGAASGPAGAINLTAPAAGTTSAAASSNPLGGQPRFGGQAPSSDPFGAGPTTTDSAPAQAGSRNSGTAFGGGGGRGAASSFGPTSGGFGQQGGDFGGRFSRAGGGVFGGGGLGGSMTMAGQNMSNMMMSKEAREYRDAENSAAQIAARLRHTAKDDPAAEKMKEELKAAVTKAFEARQAQQAAEVKRLKDKLAEIEAHVSRREKAKEVLIDERIYELTTGGGEPFGNANFGAFNAGTPFSTTPSNGLPVDAPAKAGNAPINTAPAGLQVR